MSNWEFIQGVFWFAALTSLAGYGADHHWPDWVVVLYACFAALVLFTLAIKGSDR